MTKGQEDYVTRLDELTALHARVAKLEEALEAASKAMDIEDWWHAQILANNALSSARGRRT